MTPANSTGIEKAHLRNVHTFNTSFAASRNINNIFRTAIVLYLFCFITFFFIAASHCTPVSRKCSCHFHAERSVSSIGVSAFQPSSLLA